MVGEIADFVAKHKAKLFPGSPKKTETKRPGSVGDLGKSLEQNDPETLKFIKKHETSIHGEKPEVATKHCLDNPKNARMKPKEGVYEEMEDIEEAKGCPKCGASNCTCQHEECGGKKLKTGKLKEETLSNFIALDILQEMKEQRLDELSKQLMSRYVRKAGDSHDKEIDKWKSPLLRDHDTIAKRRQGILTAAKKIKDPDKGQFEEGVSEIHKVSPGDPDYTHGMHIGKKPKAEVATGHKPAVASTEKSKKLDKRGIKEEEELDELSQNTLGSYVKKSYAEKGNHKDRSKDVDKAVDKMAFRSGVRKISAGLRDKELDKLKEAKHHHEPMPKLDNPEASGGCTGHEDPMPVIKKPHADPTKIPNRNQVPNSTQPAVGVLDKKKKKVSEETLDEVSTKRLGRYIETASRDVRNKEHISGFRAGLGGLEPDQNRERKIKNRQRGIDTAAGKLSDRWVKVKANEDVLHETLPPSASASDYIHDFVHSKNKVFKGDSKKQRIKRALGAYYHKHKKVNEGLMGAVEPLLGEAGKKGKKRTEGGPDVPIQLNKGVPNRTQNIGRDTGQNI